ncbi:MAG: cyclase family protein [Deltaproteobacteria bacterium]|nr:cyclase family protein [Deltaproteobacteria bacterium]
MTAQTRGWLDVSVPIRDGMVRWPDNPSIQLERTMDLAAGDEATVSRLSLGVHSGTHVDAPLHFIQGAAGIDEVPLENLIGRARVLDIHNPSSIGVAELRPLEPRAGERLLFRTRNSERSWPSQPFLEDFVFLSLEGAKYLVGCGVRTVGIDYLSIAGMKEGVPTHRALLEAGIGIIEGLDLHAVAPGVYELLCLPLRLAGADGAPARALLRPV